MHQIGSIRRSPDAAAQQQNYIQEIVSSPAMRAAVHAADAITQTTALARKLIQQLANSPAARPAAELSEAWGRIQIHAADRHSETFQVAQSSAGRSGPWIRKATTTVGKTVEAVYRQAAPANRSSDDTTSLVSYTAAVDLALKESIPLAWVPDHAALPGDYAQLDCPWIRLGSRVR